MRSASAASRRSLHADLSALLIGELVHPLAAFIFETGKLYICSLWTVALCSAESFSIESPRAIHTDWQGSLQSQDAALARNARREGSKRVPEDIVRRMAARLEEPDGQRYEWEQCTITFPSESIPQLVDDPQV